MSPTRAASRSKRAACRRWRSKLCRLRRKVATGPAKVERICTSPSVKPARLVRRPEQPDQLALGEQGHEHDRLRLRHEPDLLGEARVEPRLVAHVRAAAARAPQAPVLRPGHVAERPRPLVGEPVHGERRLHRARLGVLQRDADHGRPDEAGQPLGQHAVELGGLGDERPVAADLVQPREVARARLRLLAAAGELVVGGLEAQERADLQDEGGRVDRLVEEVVRPGLVAAPHGHRVPERGHHDHGEVGAVDLPDARAGLEPAHPGQPDVEEHEVEAPAGQRLEPPLRRLGAGGGVAVQAQQVHEGLADEGVVVDEEDLGHALAAVWPPPGARRQGGAVYYARSQAVLRPWTTPSTRRSPSPLLARLYRERRSGVLSIGPADERCASCCATGRSSAWVPSPHRYRCRRCRAPTTRPACGWTASWARSASARRRPGLRRPRRRPRATSATACWRPSRTGRWRPPSRRAPSAPADVAETAGATEPLILEAVRQMRDSRDRADRLGDLDQRLVATAALADERTLTLTEGYLLSRIDGATSARQVLQLVPLDPDETERTLLGLVLTGRVEYRAGSRRATRAAPRGRRRAAAGERPPGGARPSRPPSPWRRESPSPSPRRTRRSRTSPVEIEAPSPAAGGRARASGDGALDPEMLERRKEILEIFQSLPLKNHFEVLGVEPGCSDAEVKRAYATLAKRFHPDANRDPRIEDLHDILEAIFIRVGEAWEVLGDARSRASYEARFGVVRRPRERRPPRRPSPPVAAAACRSPSPTSPPEETLHQAQAPPLPGALLGRDPGARGRGAADGAPPPPAPGPHPARQGVRQEPELGPPRRGDAPERRARGPRERRRALRAGPPLQGRRPRRTRPGDVPPRGRAPAGPPRGRGRARPGRQPRAAAACSSASSAGARPLDGADRGPRRPSRPRRRLRRPRARRAALHLGERGAHGRAPASSGLLRAPRRRGARRGRPLRHTPARGGPGPRPRGQPWPPSAPSGSPGRSRRSMRACTRGPSPAGRESPGATSSSSSPSRARSASARATACRSRSPPVASPRKTARASSAPSPAASKNPSRRRSTPADRQRAASAAGFTPAERRGG